MSKENAMKVTKENICVYIEDEAQLEKAREILDRYGEGDKIDENTFTITNFDLSSNYMYYGIEGKDWGLGWKPSNSTKITLEQLEEILKGEKNGSSI